MPACKWVSTPTRSGLSFSSGDTIATSTSGYWIAVQGTLAVPADYPGGRYFEVTISSASANCMVGIGKAPMNQDNAYSDFNGILYYAADGGCWTGGGNTGLFSGATHGGAGVRIGVCLKNGKLYFRKNGTWQGGANIAAETGYAHSGITGDWFPAFQFYENTAATLHCGATITGSLPSGVQKWDNALSVSPTLVSPSGAALASTAVEWALFKEAKPSLLAAPLDKGTGTTSGSGVLSVSSTGTTIANGATAGLLISTTDGIVGNQCLSAFVPVSPTVT